MGGFFRVFIRWGSGRGIFGFFRVFIVFMIFYFWGREYRRLLYFNNYLLSVFYMWSSLLGKIISELGKVRCDRILRDWVVV